MKLSERIKNRAGTFRKECGNILKGRIQYVASVFGISLFMVMASQAQVVYQINTGSNNAVSPFSADQYGSGGTVRQVNDGIDLNGVTDPAPEAVYQSERYGNCTYTLPSLTPSATYLVRLHFAELYQTSSGARLFNVSINGSPVLSNFDIYAETGARFKGVIREFTATANTNGIITIQTETITDNATVGGIEIHGQSSGSVISENRVNASSDDAEENYSTGSTSLNSGDLELITDFDNGDQLVGIRFINHGIPAGVTIEQAYLQFTCDEAGSGATVVDIRGELSTDAETFSATTNNISGRTTTSASTNWSIPAWNSAGAAGVDQRSTDISPVVQEVVNQSGYSESSAFVFIISGSGTRTAESYDGGAGVAALLHVQYSTDGPEIPVITTHPQSQTAAVGGTATFTVVASGAPPLTYQWRRNGAAIYGATSTSYTTPTLTLGDNGAQFSCMVSHLQENVISNNATLTVDDNPLEYAYPEDCGPGENMQVDGQIKCSSLLIHNWLLSQKGAPQTPDYVFDKDYELPTLTEIEKYIKANGHLPEIPAAAELETNGIDMIRMNFMLLKKIEEMTLLMIQQEKRMHELEKKLGK